MTKKENYNAILALVTGNEELTNFIKHEIELLDKKSGSSRKPTKTQIENETLKVDILDYLATVDGAVTIAIITANVDSIKDMSNQKITHLLTALVNDNKVVKTYVKKVPYYALATDEVAEENEVDA